ncbi:hypothetical protein [Bradyrhizobium acaciae]|uniref:hypothetical protein n=1 Tax=Bradyrhizobium acaciae TaxID=2683706 RepID=UPI001E3ABEC9|nr:hypothetical protein [Bradyrhizobium acaciae]MCC8982819.1 hypothetical protein [Bradyrhizobium acaciae]
MGAPRVKCQGSANPDGRSLQEVQQRAGSKTARSVRLIDPEPDYENIDCKAWERAFLQMRQGLKPIAGPLRHGLDMVDGAPNGADIAPGAAFGKQEMPHFAGLSGLKGPPMPTIPALV